MQVFFSVQGKYIFFQEVHPMQSSSAEKCGSGGFQPVIEKCSGCDRIVEEGGSQYCGTFMKPAAKWRLGFCNLATHAKPEIQVAVVKLNPLKAAKRASGKKKK
jgi:hypothetical protein